MEEKPNLTNEDALVAHVRDVAANVRNDISVTNYALITLTSDGEVMVTGEKIYDTEMLIALLRRGLSMVEAGSNNVYDATVVH